MGIEAHARTVCFLVSVSYVLIRSPFTFAGVRPVSFLLFTISLVPYVLICVDSRLVTSVLRIQTEVSITIRLPIRLPC